MMGTLLKRLAPCVVGALGLIVLWQIAVSVFRIHPVILPPPSQILSTAWELRGTLMGAFLATAASSLLGLASSLVVGCLVAVEINKSERERECPVRIPVPTVKHRRNWAARTRERLQLVKGTFLCARSRTAQTNQGNGACGGDSTTKPHLGLLNE